MSEGKSYLRSHSFNGLHDFAIRKKDSLRPDHPRKESLSGRRRHVVESRRASTGVAARLFCCVPLRPKFFSSPEAFRSWLEEHHDQERELWVGFYKRRSGKPSITWPEAVDVALCFGWIDGVRKSLEDISYTIRFTPRKGSTWSAINLKRVQALRKQGLMHASGEKAFQQRDEGRSKVYSYEQRKTAQLGAVYEREFRANPKAWCFFRAQAPWYQRTATWWVISAKKEETRRKRLAQLIADSAQERPIPPLTRPPRPK
jgi:uncharacterized protein YdeI (YjbR/CyaY-like superfamily)